HIVLREAACAFDLESVDLTTQRTASGADFRQINGRGTVPALQLADGVLTDGAAIAQFVADLVPHKHLAPPNGTMARYHLQSWLDFIASELEAPFRMLFRRYTPAGFAETIRGQIGDRMLYVQDVLIDRGYLMGETYTIADSYLFVILEWCGKLGMDVALWPNLDAY